MRTLFLQHGSFGAAWHRFRVGGPETYRDQRASVDFVTNLAPERDVITVAINEAEHDEVLAPNLRSIGLPRAKAYADGFMAALLDRLAPQIVVCRTPHAGLLAWSRRRGVPTLPCFADLFATRGLRSAAHNLRLRWLLASPVVPCVANHSLNASRSVARALFYPQQRIVPWDWSRIPPCPLPRMARLDPAAPTAFFAGALTEAKGVADCLEAVRLLGERGIALRLTLAGGGDQAAWEERAAAMGVADRVRFLGLIPNPEVRTAMAAHDMVVVPSRHNYPEGLPNTIYEALAAGTPLILSDHPAFAGRVRDGEACLVFRAADPANLADRIAALVADPALHARLAAATGAAHDALYVGVEWTALVSMFLADPTDRTGWVARHSMTALGLR
jgi:glycosyltransferase involved in cell wall biosynthesis